MKRILAGLSVAVLVLAACRQETHFISDVAYREMVQQDFAEKQALLSEAPEDLFAVFGEQMSLEEREALQFLFAYAPFIDLTEYGGEALLKDVRHALKVREEMPWGRQVPEGIFRHFVLPVRGHNETIDSARRVFYGELRERVLRCATMEEAALEVNHWCHEKAIYRPTDARTCAPLTMLKTAYGRCGEESVFTLAALRSVGIPARQVYTPRWAHCDDNHAWIEVWTDGEWKYLGACEPEPRLNIAWFTAPVRRGVYMEARVFGKYLGNEEVTAVNANQTLVNVTGLYTDVKKVNVRVTGPDGKPVPGAIVEYRVYNYGEYYPAVVLKADENGESSLTVGLGDLLVWAGDGERFGFRELEVAAMDSVIVVLHSPEAGAGIFACHIVPPTEKEYQAQSGEEERAENDRRFMYEDSLRNAYIATFMTEEDVARKSAGWGMKKAQQAQLWERVRASRGNYREIIAFLEQVKATGKYTAADGMELLSCLTEKDLQDARAEVLMEHWELTAPFRERGGLYWDYVVNPRISNELIVAYRAPVQRFLAENGIGSPDQLIEAVSRIRVADEANTINVVTPPTGVLRSGLTDTRSREVFFVAACRTMGVPARLNPMDGKPEYHDGEAWQAVRFTKAGQTLPKGKLSIVNKGTAVKDPAYYTHFTVSRIENGKSRVIDLGRNAAVDMGGGMAWSGIFRQPVELEAGRYLLTTGNRKSDGSVLSDLAFFDIREGKQTVVGMDIRDAYEELKVLGRVDREISFVPEGGKEERLVALPADRYTALALIGVNQEPTNHLIRDMSALKEDFENRNIPLTFLFAGAEQLRQFDRKEFRPLPATLQLGYDREGQVARMLEQALTLKGMDNLPLLLVLNRKGEVVFLSRGYRIGLGNQILRFMDMKNS